MSAIEGLESREVLPSVEGLTVADFEYLQNTEGLKPGQWEGLSVEGRLETLQTIETKLAEIQGRPPVPVFASETPVPVFASETPGENGHYNPTTRTITLNVEQLNNPSQRLNLINTVAHEGRHAYQHYAIEHPGFHPDQREVDQWAENWPNYLSCEQYGGLLYRLQPIEADAWKYGRLVEEAITFGQNYPLQNA